MSTIELHGMLNFLAPSAWRFASCLRSPADEQQRKERTHSTPIPNRFHGSNAMNEENLPPTV